MLSDRIKNMTPSATIEITSKIAELKEKGIDIIKFNVGEPDFDTPDNIIKKAEEGIEKGFTRYTDAGGIIELREEIAKKLLRENNVEYNYREIIVSNGAKQAIINALMSLCNKDDEVIITSPHYVSYPEMVKIAEGKPVLVKMDEKDNFDLNIEKIKKAVTNKTKCIILNTPNNPTGTVYGKEKLKKIGKLAVENNFYIIADDVYERLIYDGENHICIASLSEKIKSKTIVISGMSKTFAMTGWRIGYAAGPKEIIQAMTVLQGHMTSCPSAPSQYASIEALKNTNESVINMVKEFDKRRKFIVKRLNEIEGINCNFPKGAFYVMPNVSSFYGKNYKNYHIENSKDLTRYLLEEAKISVVPGSVYGSDENIRIAYSNSMENIKKGIDAMEKALIKLK